MAFSHRMIPPYKSKAVTGVKKALGQLGKVLSMIERDAYCMDILQQVRAVEGLLRNTSAQVLDSHLHTCGARAFSSTNRKEQERIIEELVVAFKAAKK